MEEIGDEGDDMGGETRKGSSNDRGDDEDIMRSQDEGGDIITLNQSESEVDSGNAGKAGNVAENGLKNEAGE